MLEILIFGAVTSAIYAMLAVGFTLIFGVARILNLAHGSFYALGAYGAYLLTTVFNIPLVVATPLVVLRPVRMRSPVGSTASTPST